MKSPILILFIIFNLLAISMASATNMLEEESKQSHHVHAQDITTSADFSLMSCGDESSCDHFCHISSHLVGFLNRVLSISPASSSIVVLAQDDQFYSLIQEPPFLPPRIV